MLPFVYSECQKIFQEHAPGLVELCVNPEFLREGTALEDFDHPPFTIIGTTKNDVAQKLCEVYKDIEAPIYVLRPQEAVMIKYVSNVYHGLKVAFANEVGALCRAHGIDSHEVMKVFVKDKKLNISPKYLKPGFAFGGSCLPKDIRALLYVAKENDVELPLIQHILFSNNFLIEKTVERILSYGRKKVGLIGLSFKATTDDLRESPFVLLSERLIGKGLELSIYDPNVSLARLTGLNKTYINEVLPHISRLLVQTIDDLAKKSEIIIVGHNFKGVSSLTKHIKPSTIILDFCNISELKTHKGKYEGLSW